MSNWSKRPLSTAQLKYAALDAYILIDITDVLAYKLGMETGLGMAMEMAKVGREFGKSLHLERKMKGKIEQ